MNSIYQLKTGEAVDLSQIVQVGSFLKTALNKPHEFEIIFKTTRSKIIIHADSVGKEIMDAYDSAIKWEACCDSKGQAVRASADVYNNFCDEVRSDLINAWKQFKGEDDYFI